MVLGRDIFQALGPTICKVNLTPLDSTAAHILFFYPWLVVLTIFGWCGF